MALDDKLFDEFLKKDKKPKDLTGEKGLLKRLTKRLVERAMAAEMTQHLGYEKNAPKGKNEITTFTIRIAPLFLLIIYSSFNK
jgi:putative transposase